jgi:hypothetical protein
MSTRPLGRCGLIGSALGLGTLGSRGPHWIAEQP